MQLTVFAGLIAYKILSRSSNVDRIGGPSLWVGVCSKRGPAEDHIHQYLFAECCTGAGGELGPYLVSNCDVVVVMFCSN
jgi:hypothetical protein